MDETQPNETGQASQTSQPANPRRRMQELLTIPDGQRSDEQWDELNELEIMLASGNRERPQGQGQGQSARPPGNQAGGGQARGGGGSGGGGGGGDNARRPGKKFRHRSQRRGPPGTPGTA
ncbi:MAG: hypothetical protein EXR28_13440 [Betaproteobacteria bacterium]|nr:hypothetical protein [Betaproteobacteria bacterium]